MATLSRQYRPQTFADVTDQGSIKETLRLEVETGKLGNAYLFAGPRGVGKTTLARVFAKALNCLKPTKGEPCNTCTSCVEFNAGKSLDYIEMDAASNTGVDNVREAIIEHVRFAPSGHPYKIYSLDEAHMLSTSAWNALLKTIEEPPAYAKFIFLTTELHKVPLTIQSRCQRFDFKRVPQEALAERVRTLAKNEGVKIDEPVVISIAAKADGCVRDAETFLGQMLSLGEKHITAQVASLVLPLSRLPVAAKMLTAWSSRQLGASLDGIRETEEQGIPLLPLFDDLIEAARQLLLAADSVSWRHKLANGDEGESALAKLVGAFEPDELARIALVLMERRRDAKQGADIRLCMELAATAVALGTVTTNPSKPLIQKISLHAEPEVQVSRPIPSTSAPAPLASTPSVKPVVSPIVTPEKPTQSPTTAANTAVPTVTLLLQKWPAFLRALDEKSASLVFVMKLVRPIAVSGNCITLEFQYAFHKEKAMKDLKTKRMIEELLEKATQTQGLTIEGVIGKEHSSDAEVRDQNTTASILKAFGGQVMEESGSV